MDTQNKFQQKLQTLTYSDWVKITLVLLAAALLVYRCFLPFRAEYVYREAFNAEAGGNIPLAVLKYKEAVRLAPWETYYHIQLGKIYENQARAAQTKPEKIVFIKQAEDIYLQCLAISPTNPWYQNRMSEIYNLYGSVADTPAQAKEFAKKAEEKVIYAASLDPNNALFQLSVAYLYHQRKEFDKALKLYQHVLEIDDTMGEAYFNMADIHRQRGERKKQMELYKLSAEKNPNFKNAHFQLGRMYEEEGKLDEAIKEYIQEVMLDKNNALAFQVLGAALFKKNDWVNMEKVYHRLTLLDPNNVTFYLYKAQAQVRLGKLDNAIDTLQSAQALRPDDASIRNNISTIQSLKNGASKPKAYR